MKNFRPLAIVMACVVIAAGCGSLPRGSVERNEMLNSVDEGLPDVAVYPVNRAFLPIVETWPQTGGRPYSWIKRQRGPSHRIIAPGDTLALNIWDSGDNSLLTTPEQRVVPLTELLVSSSGTVFVPYLDEVYVLGQTPQAARQQIQDRLGELIPSAQVQLSMVSGRRNSVSLVGGVRMPGTYPLPDQDFTLLGLLSQGGGIDAGLSNPQIRLQRGGAVYGISAGRIYADPGLDTTLHGGDKIIVEEDKRYFLSLGAAGSQAPFTFARDNMSALDAMSEIGGISIGRADPQGILIFREYDSTALTAGQRGPRQQRVMFTLDLTNADGLFSARNFPIQSGDLVYVSESPLTKIQTIFRLIGEAFGAAATANSI
ncbi:MAG: polysaccharide biosynthesis/export family protein [Rhodobacteraceae bacterium]|nr:polysaccharide biosynthesis/export family protein [Paracoccaceae bacterium]